MVWLVLWCPLPSASVTLAAITGNPRPLPPLGGTEGRCSWKKSVLVYLFIFRPSHTSIYFQL